MQIIKREGRTTGIWGWMLSVAAYRLSVNIYPEAKNRLQTTDNM
jgi:hypothetical protein